LIPREPVMQVATGTYSGCFRVLSCGGGGANDALLEASRDPQRRRLHSAKARPRPRRQPAVRPGRGRDQGGMAEAFLARRCAG